MTARKRKGDRHRKKARGNAPSGFFLFPPRYSSVSTSSWGSSSPAASASAAPVYTMRVISVDGVPQNRTIFTLVPSGTHVIGWEIEAKGYRTARGTVTHTFEAGKHYQFVVTWLGGGASIQIQYIGQRY
jgi:hypothetical protein